MFKKNNNYTEILEINIHNNEKIWLFMSKQTSNALKNNGINTVRDLIECKEKQLLTFPKLGKRGIEEIKNILNSLNLKLGMNLVYDDCLKEKPLEYKSNNNFTEDIVQNNIKKNIPNEILTIDMLIDWPLSVRTFNVLKNENIRFIGDLLQYDLYDFLKFKNFGKNSLEEIKENLSKLDLDKYTANLSDWSEIRETLINNIKISEIENLAINNKIRGFKKSIFKDYKSFKEEYFKLERIKINKNLSATELEKLIIDDIEGILSLINDRNNIFFKGRYGYLEDYKTLETLGKKFGITRERVRQNEKELNLSLKNLGKIDKNSLIEYFSKYEFISFHKLFPQLDKNFTDTAVGTGEITRDKLVVFMENYCGVKEEHFKTPERELWHFDTEKLKEIFTFVNSGTPYEDFIEIIKENYGYNDFVAKSALEFMEKKDLIKINKNKIYPIKINKNFEVAHILLNYPEGLHWKKISAFGNKSYTKNKWDLDRIVGDSSLTMTSNENIYLCDKGTHKLLKFCKELNNKDKIISIFIKTLKDLNLEQSDLERIYQKVIKIDEFKNLNFYDARAIIKVFGPEKGIFHLGKSATNTIGLVKELKTIGIKQKIIKIIKEQENEIHISEINNKLQKTNEKLPLSAHLDELVEEMLIFRISPGTFLNFDDAIKLCDKKEVKLVLDKELSKYEFITSGFMREKLNDELGYGLSNFYYDSLSRVLARENNWFYGTNYLSKNSEKKISVDKYIRENYDNNLSTNENFDKISKKIGVSKMYFSNILYQLKDNYNTDWIHRDD